MLQSFLSLVFTGLVLLFTSQNVPPSACAVLTEQTIRSFFELPVETIIENTNRNASTYESCRYKWESKNKREMEVAGRTYEVPGENIVMLTISRFGDLKPVEAYEQSISPLKKNPHSTIEGLGQEAIWVPNLHQMSVLTDDNIIHVVVENYDSDDEKALAKKFTSLLMERLK